MSETKTRNSSIDIFRLFCAIIIIMGHSYFLLDICPTIAFWTSRAIPRIAVPFFLCTTGYFYINGLMNYDVSKNNISQSCEEPYHIIRIKPPCKDLLSSPFLSINLGILIILL